MRTGRTLAMLCPVVAILLGSTACGAASPTEPTPSVTPAVPSSSSPVPSGSPAAPVLDQDFADPDVVEVDGTYYGYATQPKDGSANISMASSTDLRSWTATASDPLPELPPWAANGRTWAPDVSAAADTFVMYFTAHSVDPDLQCIGVARSRDPAGPFVPVGARPLVCPAAEGGAIDPASFVDSDGKRYLLWKNDGNCCGKDTWLHLQPMSPDGLTVTGPPRRLLRQDQAWEGQLIAAPTLVRRGRSYVLLYSANDYGGDKYATGYATARHIGGPYRKGPTPLLTTEATGIIGPGGQDVVVGRHGGSTIVFHGWDPAFVYRAMYAAPLRWRGELPIVDAR